MPTNPPDDIALRLGKIRRQLDGLIGHMNMISASVNALEHDMLERYAPPRTDGEQAAQAAREIVYRQEPQEVKIIRD